MILVSALFAAAFGADFEVINTGYATINDAVAAASAHPNNESVDYQYESQAWRIESENNGLARRYTPAGAPTQANGWTYFFSAAQPMLRPEHRTHPVLAQQDYTYDTFGNLAEVRSGGSAERTFAYDGAQHLVEADLGGISTSYDYSVDNELMVEWRDGVRYQEAFEGWTNREGVVYEALLPFVTARDGELLYVLKEPDGRSNWIRRLDGTLLTDDNSGVYGAEWGLTVGGGWPLDEMHGGTRDSTDQLMHFGARHMLVEDGRWLQPEPLLYMGVTNGDLTNPLGYGPVYARGNSNLYGDPTGEFAALAVPPATAAAAVVGGVLVAAGAVAIGVAAGDPAVQSVIKAALPTSMPDAAPEHGGARAGTYLFGPEVTVSASTGETPASQGGETKADEATKPRLSAKERRARDRARTREMQGKPADWTEPAWEARARHEADMVEQEHGKDARRQMHDAKEKGEGDRSLEQLQQDAADAGQ